MAAVKGKAVVAQGGGPTAVINQTLAGLVLEARNHPEIETVYGAVSGTRGVLDDSFVDLGRETAENLERVALTPSAALLSTRDKPDEKYCAGMFGKLQAHGVHWFFYIGGNDSADAVRILSGQAAKAGYRSGACTCPRPLTTTSCSTTTRPGIRPRPGS
jgi:6-phosphofructokinase 1